MQLLHQLFDDFRCRSKNYSGLDRDVFVKFCPIQVSKFHMTLQGLWGHRIFRIMR
jgi:hypothetical protein